jgi:hypothetical protein
VPQVEKELKNLLVSLDAQNDAETRAAFGLTSHRAATLANPSGAGWVDTSYTFGINDPRYLRRGNFTRTPWKAGHPSDSPTQAFVTAPFALTATYDYKAVTGVPGAPTGFSLSQFPAQIAAIRADAPKPTMYGASYDQP